MSGSRVGISQVNGNTRRPQNISRIISPSDRPVHAQHDDLIKYIHESWSKIEMDHGSHTTKYYQEESVHHLKDFQPFDLEGYWGRRKHQIVNTVKPQLS